ncbi:MAG: Crp/Fnr family transcriptional regulator, partial [Sphingomonadales bacterium]
MTATELAALLPPHSVFAECSEAELTELLRVATLQTMKAGETILEQGEEGDAMLLLLEGVARVWMVTSNGREIILDYAEPGSVLGEIALLDGEPRTASATALWKGRLLRVKKRGFLAFVEDHPKIAMALLRDMARRLRESDTTIETDRAYATGPRLARFLKRLTEQKAHGHRLAGDLSQSELGNFVGISRENINRQLSVWAGAG